MTGKLQSVPSRSIPGFSNCTTNEKNQPDRMRIEPIQFWRWIESGLERNVSICVVACLQFRPISAMTQMLIVNVWGLGKDTPTSRSYYVIIQGHAHYPNPLCKLIVRTRSKVDWNQFQQRAFNLDPIQLQCSQVLCFFFLCVCRCTPLT